MYLGRLAEIGPKQTVFALPRHPYTRMLLDTIPDLDMTGRQRTPVAGEVPNPISPPTGCAFHPRCPFANDRCKTERPEPKPNDTGSVTACHAVEEGRLPAGPLTAAA
jgi:peptide/nickel transport system ATP-binding protein